MSPSPRKRLAIIVASCVIAAALVLVWISNRTAPVRSSLVTLSRLIVASDRGDDEELRSLCSRTYLREVGLRRADEGGLVGLPRTINKNFQAWRQGEVVLICPTGRTGPVYRFVKEEDKWRYDGIAGVLGRGG